jgi:hypothetical protein
LNPINGIAKCFESDNVMKFVDIRSHNENLRKIAEAITEDFTGNKRLLVRASAIHDLWKKATIRPDALMKRGSLFKGHSTQFPANLVDEKFDNIEFDRATRIKNFDNYYILNLVRLHHSGFGTYMLFRHVDFIFEAFEKDRREAIRHVKAFIKDWYALMTADWIDSAIMGALFNGKDLEFYLIAEISLGRRNETEFYVIQENFLKTDVILSYRHVDMPLDEVKHIIQGSRRRDILDREFLARLEKAQEEKVRLSGH